ncbi:MAG: hypothetical protein MHM6MM_004364 [Cercozoa sp. M6MM]
MGRKSRRPSGRMPEQSAEDAFAEQHERVELEPVGLRADDEPIAKPQDLYEYGAVSEDDSDAHVEEDEWAESSDEEDEVDALRREERQERYADEEKRAERREQLLTKQWGRRATNYYGADVLHEVVDSEDSAAEDEVEEAARLQQQRAEQAEMQDYEDDLEQLLLQREQEQAEALKLLDVEASLDTLDSMPEERVDDKEDALRRLQTLAPEVEGMTHAFRELSVEVRELATILQRAEALLSESSALKKRYRKELASHRGLRVLRARFDTASAHCTSLLFYLLMQARGTRQTDHPVVKRLLQTQQLLDSLDSLLEDGSLQQETLQLLSQLERKAAKRQRKKQLEETHEETSAAKKSAKKAKKKTQSKAREAALESEASEAALESEALESEAALEIEASEAESVHAKALRFMQSVADETAQRKTERAEKYTRKWHGYRQDDDLAQAFVQHGKDGQQHELHRRAASKAIIDNRGLMRYRSRLSRNPRKKMRVKFAKALAKRRTVVREYKAPKGPYQGFETGINPHVSHSVDLRR